MALSTLQTKILDNLPNSIPALMKGEIGSQNGGDFTLGTLLNNKIEFGNLISLSSAAGAGGATTATLTVTGLLATDQILAVSQNTAGANHTALVAYGTPAANALPVTWSADPGAGAIVQVLVLRQ